MCLCHIGDLDREQLYLQGLAPSLVHGLVIIPADQSSLHNTSVSIEKINFWAFATFAEHDFHFPWSSATFLIFILSVS